MSKAEVLCTVDTSTQMPSFTNYVEGKYIHPRLSLMSFVIEFLLLFTTSGHLCGSSFIRVKLFVAGCASEVEFFVVPITTKLLIIILSDWRKRTLNAKPLYHKI